MIILILLLQLSTWCVTVGPGHSRSSKSVLIESPYAISYLSSIVTVPIFCRLRDITICWSKMHFFAVLHTAVSFKALYGVPCVLGYNMRSRKLESIAGWLNGSAVERWSLTGEFSLSSVQPTADG